MPGGNSTRRKKLVFESLSKPSPQQAKVASLYLCNRHKEAAVQVGKKADDDATVH